VKEDDEFNVEDELINPFAMHRSMRERPLVPNNASRWEVGFKLDILEFQGCSLATQRIFGWVADVDEILYFKEVLEDKRVPLVATKFSGKSVVWWQQLH
jgi:hypothetical protein